MSKPLSKMLEDLSIEVRGGLDASADDLLILADRAAELEARVEGLHNERHRHWTTANEYAAISNELARREARRRGVWTLDVLDEVRRFIIMAKGKDDSQ